jgi:hypothetical protein
MRLRPFGMLRCTTNTLIAAAISVVLAASASDGGGGTRATKHYVAHSRAACETIDYRCPDGVETFEDSEGCGCLMPAGKQSDNDDTILPPVQK